MLIVTRYLAPAALLLVFVALAQDQPAVPPPEGIIARMLDAGLRRDGEMRQYTSHRRYFMENKRFGKKAESHIRMTFRHPDVKEFAVESESGLRYVRQKVFHRMMETEKRTASAAEHRLTRIAPENYDFTYRGPGEDRGRPAYMFDIAPKTKNEFLICGRIWVDAADFAITRIEGQPAKKPSIWVRETHFVHLYQKVGAFWLAEANTSETDVRVFGKTIVDIRYSGYNINPSGN